VADFNADGNADIVAGLLGDEITGPMAFFSGKGAVQFGAPVTRPPENNVGSYATVTMQAVDMNKDGLQD